MSITPTISTFCFFHKPVRPPQLSIDEARTQLKLALASLEVIREARSKAEQPLFETKQNRFALKQELERPIYRDLPMDKSRYIATAIQDGKDYRELSPDLIARDAKKREIEEQIELLSKGTLAFLQGKVDEVKIRENAASDDTRDIGIALLDALADEKARECDQLRAKSKSLRMGATAQAMSGDLITMLKGVLGGQSNDRSTR